MSHNNYQGIARGVFAEQWPGYVPVDTRLLRWSKRSQVRLEVMVDLEVDPTEESNAVSWGNN